MDSWLNIYTDLLSRMNNEHSSQISYDIFLRNNLSLIQQIEDFLLFAHSFDQ